jgi:hypothetical protein
VSGIVKENKGDKIFDKNKTIAENINKFLLKDS